MVKNASIFVLVTLFLFLAFLLRLYLQKPAQVLPKNQEITFEATLKKEPALGERWQVLRIADGTVYTQLFPKYEAGDRIQISGKIDERGRVFYPQIERVGKVSGIRSLVAGLRNKIAGNISQLLPSREASLLTGTVLGIDNIERSFRDQLIATGTIHVVVVSGQNLAIVAGIFTAFSKYIGRRKALFLACLAVVLYAVLVGFSAPVMRAAIMVLAATVAVYFGREVWPVWNLILAAFLIIFLWPQAIFEVSFQLTFAATLGILTLGKWIGGLGALGTRGPVEANTRGPVANFLPVGARSVRRSDRSGGDQSELRAAGSPSVGATPRAETPRAGWSSARTATRIFWSSLVNNAAIATSAYLFTLPIIFFNFGRISLTAPLVNVLVAEAVFPIMALGFLTAGASLIFMPLAQILAYFAYVPAFYFVKVVEVFSKISVGNF